MGTLCFHTTRKCGNVFFKLPENVGTVCFHIPENVGKWRFQATRKCGNVLFSRYQKIWVLGVDVTRKCGHRAQPRDQSQSSTLIPPHPHPPHLLANRKTHPMMALFRKEPRACPYHIHCNQSLLCTIIFQ